MPLSDCGRRGSGGGTNWLERPPVVRFSCRELSGTVVPLHRRGWRGFHHNERSLPRELW